MKKANQQYQDDNNNNNNISSILKVYEVNHRFKRYHYRKIYNIIDVTQGGYMTRALEALIVFTLCNLVTDFIRSL